MKLILFVIICASTTTFVMKRVEKFNKKIDAIYEDEIRQRKINSLEQHKS